MAIYFENIKINSFRGIENLEILNLKDINIIAGNNNVGKTSILEAIALLKNPYDFYEVLKVAQMRENAIPKAILYEDFISMFPLDRMVISVEGIEHSNEVVVEIRGMETDFYTEKRITRFGIEPRQTESVEVTGFVGELYGEDYKGPKASPIQYSYLSELGNYNTRTARRNIVYVPPGAHLRGKVFSQIVRNDSYKEICIRLVQLFDQDIIDLLYLDNEKTMRAVEYIKHRRLGIMPLSTYGDGIKRVLMLANSIAAAAGGILMIDEVETSINYKYYNDIFNFLIKACRQYRVQVFVTTHNIEAIDAMLGTQNYANDVEYDPINVVTFRKDEDASRVLSRSMSGAKVFESREKFDLEVRL